MSRLTSFIWNRFPLMRHLFLWHPGHYYSPIPSLRDIRPQHNSLFGAPPDRLPGIDLNVPGQLETLDALGTHHAEIPFPDEASDAFRYCFRNPFFGAGDGTVLFCMMRQFKPKRIIEVGSGFLSSLMLDTNERFFDGTIHCTFIEPYPARLLSLLREGEKDRIHLIR